MLQIAEGVFEIAVGFVHVHLVLTDDGVVLVDTGLPGKSRTIERALGEARKTIGDVRTILLTHWHADHVGGAAALRRRSGARTVAHAIDAPVITGAVPMPLPAVQRTLARLVTGKPEPVMVDESLSADGPVSVPGFSAFHTPGHTAGHVSYLLDRADGILFAGDAATGGGTKVRHMSRTLNADPTTARSSVAKLAALSFDVAVFGHGKAVAGGAVERFRDLAAR
ncbi:MBL fold metallo-hydrolase [Jidongwangia harbinensis]|uniref:MBL fold metallo-hydrolase n=1 Tax=Jidongwangia harbinensis TaxID=2878561 RepID=UPI001CD9DDC7|nr:MBL fold metallo-hydrolase [Jidongwangia harbinensis]MCA2218377.1 MBL fold metallo-hydrolase [Jidongwangia harbinensis]